MKLMTKEIERKMPALYSTEEVAGEDKILRVKYFTPWAGWTWFGVEYDPETKVFFGFVDGMDSEWGYFSLEELESIKGPFGLKIERDLYFKPCKLKERR